VGGEKNFFSPSPREPAPGTLSDRCGGPSPAPFSFWNSWLATLPGAEDCAFMKRWVPLDSSPQIFSDRVGPPYEDERCRSLTGAPFPFARISPRTQLVRFTPPHGFLSFPDEPLQKAFPPVLPAYHPPLYRMRTRCFRKFSFSLFADGHVSSKTTLPPPRRPIRVRFLFFALREAPPYKGFLPPGRWKIPFE